MAATKAYLKMEPIIGDSKNPRYKKAVEVEQYSLDWDKLGAAGTGYKILNDLYLFLLNSKSAHQFHTASASGQHFKEAVLTVEVISKDDKIKKLFIFKMYDVAVSNFQIAAVEQCNACPLSAQVQLMFKKSQLIIP